MSFFSGLTEFLGFSSRENRIGTGIGAEDAVVVAQTSGSGTITQINNVAQAVASATAGAPLIGAGFNIIAVITESAKIYEDYKKNDMTSVRNDLFTLGADGAAIGANLVETFELGAIVLTAPEFAVVGIAAGAVALGIDIHEALEHQNETLTESNSTKPEAKLVGTTVDPSTGQSATTKEVIAPKVTTINSLSNTGARISERITSDDYNLTYSKNGAKEVYTVNPDGSSTDIVKDAKGDYSKTTTDYAGNSINEYKNVNGSHGNSKTLVNGYASVNQHYSNNTDYSFVQNTNGSTVATQTLTNGLTATTHSDTTGYTQTVWTPTTNGAFPNTSGLISETLTTPSDSICPCPSGSR